MYCLILKLVGAEDSFASTVRSTPISDDHSLLDTCQVIGLRQRAHQRQELGIRGQAPEKVSSGE